MLEKKESASAILKAYQMTTEAIRNELGSWGEEYIRHRTGERQLECAMLFGERRGIVEWLTQRGIIGSKESFYKAPDNFYPKHRTHPGEIKSVYYFIKDIAAWKFFERKLDLWRELEGRRYYAEAKEKEGKLGEDPRAWEKEIASKVSFIKSNVKCLNKSF